jgi:hypothetical protein
VGVSGIGHSVVGSDASGCAAGAVRRFLAGRRVPRRCAGSPQIHPSRREPTSLRAVRPARRTRGRVGRTLAAVRLTYQDALGLYFDLLLQQIGADLPRYAAGGLRAGSYVFARDRAVLRSLVYVPGVTVSGRLRSVTIFPDGVLRVRGRAAARGRLRVHDGVMTGRLGGRRVRGRLGPDLFDLFFEQVLGQ